MITERTICTKSKHYDEYLFLRKISSFPIFRFPEESKYLEKPGETLYVDFNN